MRYLLLVWISMISTSLAAQTVSDAYPQGYFRNPLDIPISLAGGFAECRPNHFHTGIDIKTNQRENLKVRAAADGYIARISISHTGYGNCLYVNHPNGYTTVYGHLNDFYPELQQWVMAQQYEQEQWAVELFPPPGKFPVKKGAFIAYSGTTGGSTGPHLHFEIRDTKSGEVLNALLFGLPFTDTKPPRLKRVAIYDGERSIYEQEPKLYSGSLQHGVYRLPAEVISVSTPAVFIGVQAQDYTNNSHNWLGIYQMRLFLDDSLQLSTRFSALDFSQNRYVNAYADFKRKEETGVWYQVLYRLPNNHLAAYPYHNNQNGLLILDPGAVHQVRVEMEDVAGNTSVLQFNLKYDGMPERAAQCPDGEWWPAQSGGSVFTPTLQLEIGSGALYDAICFKYEEIPSDKGITNAVQLYDASVPLQRPVRLALKIQDVLPLAWRSKIAFVHHIRPASLPGNNPQNGMAAHFDRGWAVADVQTFGNYYAVIDTVPPVIKALQEGSDFSRRSRLAFRVSEAETKIAGFRAELDGKWLRFVRVGNTFTYRFDEHCGKGKHRLVVTAWDENRNERILTLDFQR